MPNIASVLKDEIARVARKQARGELAALKKASAQHRTDLAALKRRLATLEQQLKRVGKVAGRKVAAEPAEGADGRSGLRFSAKGFGTLRKKLGVSAADMALLLGVSGQSVYKWEDGKARPRASQLPAISSIRGLGKREVAAKLAELAKAPPVPKKTRKKRVAKKVVAAKAAADAPAA